MIPKIIHHIAPKFPNSWHYFWQKCYDSWKTQFSDYEFIMWNDKDDIDNFVKIHYKEHWNLYRAFPFHIMRIDFARLCILHKFGGIYADMDVFCYKNFEHLLTNEVYFLEKITDSKLLPFFEKLFFWGKHSFNNIDLDKNIPLSNLMCIAVNKFYACFLL